MTRRKPTPLPSSSSWSFDLPTQLRLAIADVVILVAKIDSAILEVLWLATGVKGKKRLELVKMKSSEVDKLIKIGLRQLDNTDAIEAMLTEVRNERHLIAHGVWMIVDGQKPFVLVHRDLDDHEGLVGYFFPYSRFNDAIEQGELLLRTFQQMRDDLRKALGS